MKIILIVFGVIFALIFTAIAVFLMAIWRTSLVKTGYMQSLYRMLEALKNEFAKNTEGLKKIGQHFEKTVKDFKDEIEKYSNKD